MDVLGHKEIQEEIPAYVAGRLDPEGSRRLGDHLLACADCSQIEADLREIAGMLAESGRRLFESHPDPSGLLECAGQGGGSPEPGVREHVESCARCQLVVDSLSGIRPAGARTPSARSSRVAVMAAAAGMLIGIVLGVLWGWGRAPEAPGPGDGAANIRSLREGMGASQFLYLRALRGGSLVNSFPLDPAARSLGLALPAEIPAEIEDSRTLVSEIRREGGEVVWRSQPDAAGRLRSLLESSELLLYHVPVDELGAGKFVVTLTTIGQPPVVTVFRGSFELFQDSARPSR